ncbi:ATP-binding protein [Caenispirillum salinarum]|uniref:cache domain-containing sensor histidine kinase n=1 Tax=Caenispirillum salinarum TaxID=859058 RepID=UPI0038516BAF
MRPPSAVFLRTSRTTLFWFALAVIVPVVVLGVYNGLEGRRHALDQAGLEAARLAAAVAEQHRSLVESVHALMVLTARDDAVVGEGGAACTELLATMAERSPLVSGLARAAGDGRVDCAAGSFGAVLSTPETSAMGNATLTGAFSSGPGFVPPQGERALVPFALPLAAVDADGLPLYLIANINLAWLQARIDRLEAPPGSLILVTDHDNAIITTAPHRPDLIGRSLPRGAEVGGDGAAVAEATLETGRPRVVAVRDFQDGVRVAVALDRRAVLASADAAFGRNVGLLIVVAILSLVMADAIGDRAFVAPLRRLTRAAGAMADGNLSSRFGRSQTAAGEIRDLAATFDAMADRLQRREMDLTTANGRLSAVIDAAQDGILTIDGNGIIRAANPAGARMLGYGEGDLNGMPVTALMENTPRNHRLLVLAAAGRHGGGGFRREITARHRTAGGLPVRVTLGRYDDIHGPRFVAVVHDVSGEKRQQAELERARRAAEQASAAKSAFLATMSHELRTPLNAILGFSETIRDRVLGPDPDGRFYAPYAGHIHDAGTHLLTLINDILDLSKLEAGKMDIRPEPTPCGSLAESALLLVSGLADRRGVHVSADIPPGLPPVLVDPRAGKQMLVNLLSNALRFTDPDGRVEVRARAAGPEHVALTVRDTGIGMTPDQLEQALEAFGQVAEGARRVEAGGTGLGLPLVKALAELHGGRFHISSTKGQGTAVTVVLASAPGGTIGTHIGAPTVDAGT